MQLRFGFLRLMVLATLFWSLSVAHAADQGFVPQSGKDFPAAAPSATASESSLPKHDETAANNSVAGLCAPCVRENLTYLAGPALHGRGSGTEDEHHAAEFIATKLKQYGLQPAAGDGGYIQTVTVQSQKVMIHTWNVLAKIPGEQQDQVILLSAHMDHLGMIKGKIYPGADDDASGTATVMELARALAEKPRPRRTVVFALWGSEETGLLGSRYFLQYPTFDLKTIVANLEFEMVARPDPAVKADALWLTGWDRSDLGPALAAQGANLVADPHPKQNFFTRSDNYALAQKGIVAQTVSSFGLHKDYHQPSDTLEKVDWTHLDQTIASLIGPVTWLANNSFVPKWK